MEGLPTRLEVVGGAGRPRLPAEEDSANGRLIALAGAQAGRGKLFILPDVPSNTSARRTDAIEGVGIHIDSVIGL